MFTDHRSQITDYQAAALSELAPPFELTGIDGQPYRAGRLAYRGAIDDRSFRQRTATYLSDALETILAGRQPGPAETPPYGCALVRFASLETVTPGEEAR